MKNVFSIIFIALGFIALQANAATYRINGDVAGELTSYDIVDENSLYSVARTFDLGIIELMAANPGVDPWLLEPGSSVILPTMHILPKVPRTGIVINLSELRLFYFIDSQNVMTFPIGIGKEGWNTPVGLTSIVLKRKDPTWTPPASIRQEKPDLPDVVPAGPDNPMGAYALSLGLDSIAIHGTNKPYGIGVRSSHGCIRMYPEDIEVLFNAVKQGTPVRIIDEPYKIGWSDNMLFLQVKPTQEQGDDLYNYKQVTPLSMPEIKDVITKMTGEKADIKWDVVKKTIDEHTGIPALVLMGWE